MFNGAVFAFANERRPCQNDRQHRNIVDNRHDCQEPLGFVVRVEGGAHDEVYWGSYRPLAMLEIAQSLLFDDVLDVARSDPGLCQCGSIDINLHRRAPAGENVVFKFGGTSRTKTKQPEFIPGSISLGVSWTARLNCGSRIAPAIRR